MQTKKKKKNYPFGEVFWFWELLFPNSFREMVDYPHLTTSSRETFVKISNW